MAFLEWMKKTGGGKDGARKEPKVFLSYAERCALRRMTQHFDDGLVGYTQGGAWEKTFNRMAERLELRPRDPFGERSVSISGKEAEALKSFQAVYERDARREVYVRSRQMQSDAEAVRDALERQGPPQSPPLVTKRASVGPGGKGREIEF